MDFLDYRESLGIGFCDEEKREYFLANVYNFLDAIAHANYIEKIISSSEYFSFCNLTGSKVNIDAYNDFDSWRERYTHCLSILDSHKKNIKEFLSYYVAFVNSISPSEGVLSFGREAFAEFLTDALKAAHIQYEVLRNEEEIFVFPKGVPELDTTLVSQPLEWLKDYPSARTAWIKALEDYSESAGDNASDIADKFRKALETFFQQFFGGDKSLENYKSAYGDYLKQRNVPKEISGNFETVLQAYTNYINNYAKHRDRTSDTLLEYIMYQTGNIIRLLIVLKQEETAHAD